MPALQSEKMDAPSRWIPARWQEEMVLIDLSSYSDEELLTDGKLGVFLLVLKHIYNQDMLDTLEKLIPYMQKVEVLKDGADFLITVFRYLYETSRQENIRNIDRIALKSFSKETEMQFITIAEHIRQETRKEVWQEAEANTKKLTEKFALKLIEDGMDDMLIVRYTELSLQAVEQLKQKHRRA